MKRRLTSFFMPWRYCVWHGAWLPASQTIEAMMGRMVETEETATWLRTEKPIWKLPHYYIAATEVTQAQWKALMDTDPSFSNGDNFPVERISWEEAMAFCEKLSRVTGKRYTLPTEAQWEFAARGGNLSMGYKYSGSDSMDDVAWFKENSGNKIIR